MKYVDEIVVVNKLIPKKASNRLEDKIYRIENFKLVFKRVKKNKGVPGIDGESVSDFVFNLDYNIEFLHDRLKTNTYKSKPVRRVEIEKPDKITWSFYSER